MSELPKSYKPQEVEEKVYKVWEESGYFNPDNLPERNQQGEPWSMVLPPPNVTGVLHAGHALMLTIEDILIRFQRMKGKKALWLPGTDHAAIATQSKVENILYKKEGKTKHDLGREKFLKMVNDFAKSSHDTIVKQMKKMGASVDWSREAFTLDEQRNKAVNTAFKKMYGDGLIYQGSYIVNWDPKMQTTVSDDEMKWKEEKTPFYYFKYGPFTIGTARPETKFGDKYVVMHPDDERYKKYEHNQKIEVEWINGKIAATIIKDEAVDPEFGTGVMTITPWHDTTDFEIAKRHGLDMEQIIDKRGLLKDIAGEFAGEHIKKSRPKIVEKLKEKGLFVKTDEDYTHRIATNSRGGGLIEPQVMKQWFVDVDKVFEIPHSNIDGIKTGEEVTLKQLMRHVVETGQVKIIPERFEKIYYHWIDNLRDWCISRQIWYGHRIPVYYRKKRKSEARNSKSETAEEVYVGVKPPEGEGWKQDPDTLDTWFSSGLWTLSTLGWPQDSENLKTFHPTNVLETGYDILFFWVARMILMTTYLVGEIPFKTVYLHGLVRDKDRQKMSKSKGNVVDPLGVIEDYGADALRLGLVFGTAPGTDPVLDLERVKGMKHFTNKLWNISRFIMMNLENKNSSQPSRRLAEEARFRIQEKVEPKTDVDKEILEKLGITIKEVTENLEKFRLHEASQSIYQFTWHEFADVYLEATKDQLIRDYADEDKKEHTEKEKDIHENTKKVLLYCLVNTLKLAHPFMPFVTEEIWQTLKERLEIDGDLPDLLMIQPWPKQ